MLTAHGYIQGDDRLFFDSPSGEAYDKFLFRRIRANFEGTVFHVLDFRFMPDFGQNNSQIQDAYIELNVLRAAKPRVGKFKTPIGLEVLKSDRDLVFAERSMASDLVPLRELGAQIAGSILSDTATYAVGYFYGTTDGSNGAFAPWRNSKEGVMRIFAWPFAKVAPHALGQDNWALVLPAPSEQRVALCPVSRRLGRVHSSSIQRRHLPTAGTTGLCRKPTSTAVP